MASSGYSDKEFRAKLSDVGHKLLEPPSSTAELLILLEEVEKLLPFVPQNPSSRSMKLALYPAHMALSKDEILKHPDPDVQIAVASCTNEMTKISAPTFTYADDTMKEVFRLFMNAFKHLSCGSGVNFERALRILEYMVRAQSCVMMLDLEIEPMIVEMFHIFLDTIKPNHCTAMFDYMKSIIILIIEESDDISVELLKPLLSHVKTDRKNTSPKSWELAKSVFEACAAKLQNYVRGAVKEMKLNVNDYAEIIASLCQDMPNGGDTAVGSSLYKPAKANQSDVKEKGSKSNKQTKATKGGVVPSSSVGAGKEKVSYSGAGLVVKDKNESTCQKHDSAIVLEKVMESSPSKPAKAKKSKVDEKGSKKAKKMSKGVVHSNTVGAEKDQKHELADAVEKVAESPPSKLAKGKQSKVEEKGSNKQKRKTIVVVPSSPVGEEKEKVSHCVADREGKDENKITSQKHESGNVADKVVKSPISKPTEAKQSEVNRKGSKKWKKKSKGGVVPSSSVVAEKDNVSNSGADSVVKDKNENTSEKHESSDFVEKVSETPIAVPAKEKGSKKQNRTTKSVLQSSALGVEKEKVCYSAFNLENKKENGNSSQEHEKYESADVVDKVVMPELANAEYPWDLDPENENEPMDFRLEYGKELVNLRIMVWWPLDETFYTGTVEFYDPVTKQHKIKYDDGDEETLDMSEERWELCSEKQPQQSSREREADPSPSKEHGNRNQKKTRKGKAVSSKKEHAGSSSERSKSEGCNNVKSGHSALQSIPVVVESDDESHEANFSWKARALSRAGTKGPKTG